MRTFEMTIKIILQSTKDCSVEYRKPESRFRSIVNFNCIIAKLERL
jgi:hypothetical protein